MADEKSDGPCSGLLTTGEMARLSVTTLRTVRFYEAEGLISAEAREDGCQRRFPQTELTKLQTIIDLREAGLSLQEIKDLVALKQKSGCVTAPDAAERMTTAIAARLAEIEKRACALERVRRELVAMTMALETCKECTKPAFPTNCRGCTESTVKDAERPNVLLWKHSARVAIGRVPMSIDRARAAKAVEELLAALGHPPSSDPELTKTGQQVADAWSSELLAGYEMDAQAILAEALPTSSSEIVALRNVQTSVMCPHHLLPAPGVVHLAYAPGTKIVGLGALSRLVQCFARRLTLQEALVQNVADALVQHLGATGAACVADLRPTCLTVRGEREASANVITIGTAGSMRAGEPLHATVVELLKAQSSTR